ncbi:hypothetical protein EVAR_5983_1 [Eumeta japonica]|uniref:Uncharacterized protein n=1 Tax=Eumeta variegata TaxID=151549 RepID=A0A4C1TAG9_EUMVA|nr:hypothetical protein EVAR_5983_1 [Eumeta japonica]
MPACGLQKMINKMNDSVKKKGTKINVGKTKVMVLERGESTTEREILTEGGHRYFDNARVICASPSPFTVPEFIGGEHPKKYRNNDRRGQRRREGEPPMTSRDTLAVLEDRQ